MSKRRVTWTVFTSYGPTLECSRCGWQWGVVLPISVRALVKLIAAFNEEHRYCSDPKEQVAT